MYEGMPSLRGQCELETDGSLAVAPLCRTIDPAFVRPPAPKSANTLADAGNAPLTRYTFKSFLVNRKNDFPLAAAREAVFHADKPPYTPLVFHGQSGTGKTHLLGAMVNSLQSDMPSLPFWYGGTEILEQAQNSPKALAAIGERIVFIDDVQRIYGNSALQDTLTVLLDMFHAAGRLLVLSLDVSPSACTSLSQKLLSRLTSGLVVELKKPDLDIRRQYIQNKNIEHGLDLGKDEILTLAQRYQEMRTIDGALTRLLAYRSLVNHQDANLSMVLESDNRQKMLTPAIIGSLTARHFSVNPDDMTGKSRNKIATEARHVAMFLCRELLGLSLMQVGQFFGGRDHSSVLYSVKKVKQLQESNRVMNNHISQLKKLCLTPPT